MSRRRTSQRPPARWSDNDRQAFADRNILRAQTIPSKRVPPPEADEWEDHDPDYTYSCRRR